MPRYLLLLVADCCCCYFPLQFAICYCCLLRLIAASCCCVCSYLLVVAASNPPNMVEKWPKTVQTTPTLSQDGPRGFKSSQNAPRDTPERRKMPSRSPKRASGASQESPEALQKSSPERPGDPQEHHVWKVSPICSLFAPSRVQNESQKRRKKWQKRRKNARVFLRSVFTDFSWQKSSKTDTNFDRKIDENLKRRFLENRCFT